MIDKELQELKAKEKTRALRALGPKHKAMVELYQHTLLRTPEGKLVLKDLLMESKVFAIDINEKDLDSRNHGIKLIYTLAGAHIDSSRLDTLFTIFIDALAEYEQTVLPIEDIARERGRLGVDIGS